MLFRPFLSSLALACSVAAAQSAATSPSADCERALRALQAREDVAASAPDAGPRADGRRRAPDARLLALRRQAAQVCLGGKADLPMPQRQVHPPVTVAPVTVQPVTVAPVTVAPVTVAPVPVPPVSVSPASSPLPQRNAPPTVITSCDPTGCWASDGSRLNRMGQNLLGPRGLCSVQGNLLQCP